MNKLKLTLYITGQTQRSDRAVANLRRICEKELKGACDISIVDVLEHPQMAEDKKILATPTLIKELPLPIRRIIGDLYDNEKILEGLDIVHVTGKNKGKGK